MYSIGQLSKHTGVTVRTLDYYDEIGLLTPSAKTSGGHRLYDEDDVMRLQQILALKYMRFSLEQIKEHLKDSTMTWKQSIKKQIDMVRQEQERLQILEKALQGVSYSIEFEGDINWSIVFRIIQLFQKEYEDVFDQYKEYLTSEDIAKLMQFNNELTEEDITEWMASIQAIKKHIDLDPSSVKARTLVERWATLADSMFAGDEELLGNMWKSMENKDNIDQEGIAFYPMDREFIGFIEAVFIAHHEGEEV